MLNLILFGPPGSGKGTQAAMIAEKYDLLHLSTGDMLRSEIQNDTALGQMAKKFIDEGKLVTDEVIIGMIDSKIDSTSDKVKGYLFDGFPRTQAQAEALDKMLDGRSSSIARVLALDVTEEEITKRILERGKTSGRSDDNDKEIIRSRFRIYTNKTAPVANHYGSQNKLSQLAGEGSIDDIFGSLCKAIDSIA
ncbi:MAG: adenylate kinase [Limisphaerales bacterium]|jgi:adenylate kinase